MSAVVAVKPPLSASVASWLARQRLRRATGITPLCLRLDSASDAGATIRSAFDKGHPIVDAVNQDSKASDIPGWV
eukprot:gene10218-biopygen3482